MVILFKNEKGVIEIQEKKLMELLNEAYNDGYDAGYFDGYSESESGTESDCKCNCECKCVSGDSHEKTEPSAKNSENSENNSKPIKIKGYAETKTNHNGEVETARFEIDSLSSLREAIKKMSTGGWF